MEPNEARELIDQTAGSLGMGDKLRQKHIDSIIEESDGHPM